MSFTAPIDSSVGLRDSRVSGCRPNLRISDLWKTPLHDFPIRDEILYQWLPLSRNSKVLEIGPGSGITAFRLSRNVAEITAVDFGARNVGRLSQTYHKVSNLRFICADVSSPDFLEKVPNLYDVVFGLDFFEYVTDPYTCISNLTAAVRPGGLLLLQWPNYVPARTGGVTYIPTQTALTELLTSNGLISWEVFALQLRPHASTLFQLFHEAPIRIVRRFRQSDPNRPPQLFDDTWAFQSGQRLESCKLLIHAYWWALSIAMRIGGDSFRRTPVAGSSLDGNLLLLARR